jgi:uncharacterized protein (TIGR02391 family)
MIKNTKKSGGSAPKALKMLWEKNVLENWMDQGKIAEALSKRGNNFSSGALRKALSRARYLSRRNVSDLVEYAQKKPFVPDAHGEVGGFNFDSYVLHPTIIKAVDRKYDSQHYAEAVEASFKEVIKRVKDFTNNKTKGSFDGDRAMNRAFGFEKQDPLIKFNGLISEEEKDEQRGIMNLFKGIVGIRNRKAHENITLNDPVRALEYLTLASLLMRLLDEYMK